MLACHPLEALCHPRRHKGISSYCRAFWSPVRYELELGARNGVLFFGFLSSNGPEKARRLALTEGLASSVYHLVSCRNEGKVWDASTGGQRGTAWGYGVTSER